jgi:hypothetical protein
MLVVTINQIINYIGFDKLWCIFLVFIIIAKINISSIKELAKPGHDKKVELSNSKGLMVQNQLVSYRSSSNNNEDLEIFIEKVLTDIATAKSIRILDGIYHSKIKSLPHGSGKKVILGVLKSKRESFLRQYV